MDSELSGTFSVASTGPPEFIPSSFNEVIRLRDSAVMNDLSRARRETHNRPRGLGQQTLLQAPHENLQFRIEHQIGCNLVVRDDAGIEFSVHPQVERRECTKNARGPFQMEEFQKIGLGCGSPFFIQNFEYEEPVNIAGGCEFWGECSLGTCTYINKNAWISGAEIGRYCSIGQDLIVNPGGHGTGHFTTHPFPYDTGNFCGLHWYEPYHDIIGDFAPDAGGVDPHRLNRSYRVIIGNDVWIGCRATILSGVTVGHGSVIGAGAVVTKDVEPYTVVGGVPAKVIRRRLPDAISERLLRVKWWDLDLRAIKREANYYDIEQFLEVAERLRAAGDQYLFRPRRWRLTGGGNNYQADLLQDPSIAA